MRRTIPLLLFILALPLAGDEVQVFAAVSLTEPLNEIATDWRRTTGTTVVFNFAASSILARQVAAQWFLEHLTSRAALRVFARHGFIIR